MDEDQLRRLRELEEFVAEVRGGRRILLWLASAIGGLAAIFGVFWDRLFGS